MAPERNIATRRVRTPELCGGRPRVAGTGVTVRRMVGWSKLGFSPEDIADEFGCLSLAQVDAALSYDHFLAQQLAEKALKALLYAPGEELVIGHSVRQLC